ncbi:hypothetical protein N836_22720 [Leptolyngbya sp. Heron Island J]|uniref:hypothetical protein n=1 Tax=Leptolyngbya sp. Heron Island J TaxID=1385935 RepID=UPI0003B94EBC|nr:hypothetical protein [Leptolyngbya sp. Heron Island J]ESA33208.1 hypothetical protein N836_22720 [Leptolyngbya sp. Heron Island J]
MVQLITLLLVVAALLILVLQNLTPVLELVILGNSVGALPLSVWLLGAIAIGALCTLLIHQLVPQKRAYRPIGRRLNDPETTHNNRFVDSPNPPTNSRPSSRGSAPSSSRHQDPYDNDWETFRAPEQWDDWGQQQTTAAARDTFADRPRPSVGDAIGDAVKDIESGWGDDDYEASARYASRQDPGPDIGWEQHGSYRDDRPDQPSPRTYEDGWIYGDNAPEENPPSAAKPEEATPEAPEEDVYDANYRVIIPPYEGNDKDV